MPDVEFTRSELLERALQVAQTYEPVTRFSSFFEDEDGDSLTLPTVMEEGEYDVRNPKSQDEVCRVCLAGCTYLAGWQLMVEAGADTNGKTLTAAVNRADELGLGYNSLDAVTIRMRDEGLIEVSPGNIPIQQVTMHGDMAPVFEYLIEQEKATA